MLFRAVAFRYEHAGLPLMSSWPEVHVFFEAADEQAAPAQLLRQLALAWGVDAAQVDFYNLWAEAELVGQALCEASTGDLRLLETGFARTPLFCDPARTLFFVTPPTLARLVLAQERARTWRAWQAVRADLRDQVASHNPCRKGAAEIALRRATDAARAAARGQ